MAADVELEKAEKAAPGLEETAQAQLAIVELKTPKGQLTNWFNRACRALDLGDNTAAERAISEAERLDIQNRDVRRARDALSKEQDLLRSTAKN